MTEPHDLQQTFDDVNASIPPSVRAAEHRAMLLRRAETVTGSADARPLDWSAPASTNGLGRHKRMKKRTIIALAAALMLVSTALAQQIIQFFTPDDDDQSETTLYYEPQPDFEGREEEFIIPPLDELAPSLPFTPLLPAELPASYEVEIAHFDERGQVLEVIYSCQAGNLWGFMVAQSPISSDELSEIPPMNVGASAVIEDVQIGDVSGQYVAGGWRVVVPEVRPEGTAAVQADMEWDNEMPWFMLRWHDGGMLYTLQSAMGSVTRIPQQDTGCELDRDDVIAIAENLAPYLP
jgi:hypothetical protein